MERKRTSSSSTPPPPPPFYLFRSLSKHQQHRHCPSSISDFIYLNERSSHIVSPSHRRILGFRGGLLSTTKPSTDYPSFFSTSQMDEKTEKAILEHLDSKGEIPDSGDFASAVGIDHSEIVNITKRLYGFKIVEAEEIKRDRWVLTDEGKLYASSGSPEVQLFSVVPPEGISRDELQKKVDTSIFKIGTSYVAKNKWLEMGKQVSRKVEHVEDHVKDLLLMIKDGKVVGQDDINNLKRRKLIVLQTWSGYSLKKGTNFSLERKKLVTDFSKEHLQRYEYEWKREESEKNVLRTHTTAVSARMLYALAQAQGKSGRPVFFPHAARKMDTLNDLLAASDLVSIHCALSNEIVQIINAECLQHIKPVNCTRPNYWTNLQILM